jgi:hypothetical protein
MSTTGVITATGTKGLLQWMKTYQPALYAAANPKLLAYAKQQNAKANQAAGANGATQYSTATPPGMGRYIGAYAQMEGLGDYYAAYATPGYTSSSGAPPSIDLTSEINASMSDVGAVSVATPDLTIPPTSGATDSASVASSTPTSSGFASIISSIAKGIGTVALTSAQVNANNTLLQTNLARAQQGLPPLTATTSASGLTTLGSSSTLLLLGGALLIGAMALGKK